MKEYALQNIQMVKKQAQLIPLNFGRSLVDKGILGEDEQEIVRNAVSFLLIINCALRVGDEFRKGAWSPMKIQ